MRYLVVIEGTSGFGAALRQGSPDGVTKSGSAFIDCSSAEQNGAFLACIRDSKGAERKTHLWIPLHSIQSVVLYEVGELQPVGFY